MYVETRGSEVSAGPCPSSSLLAKTKRFFFSSILLLFICCEFHHESRSDGSTEERALENGEYEWVGKAPRGELEAD